MVVVIFLFVEARHFISEEPWFERGRVGCVEPVLISVNFLGYQAFLHEDLERIPACKKLFSPPEGDCQATGD